MKYRAYVLIQAEKGQADTVATELSGKEGILTVDRVFGQHDLVAVIEALNLEGLVGIVRNEIAPSPHVARTETLVVTSGMVSQGRKAYK
jgi:DNA-binding Lrp family transcriptional regulator